MTSLDRPAGDVLRNADVDWHAWPVERYIAENYAELHPADAAVIDHHSAFYRGLPPDGLGVTLEFGAGPNLYPLMLAAACSRRIVAAEPSDASVAYLRRQLPAPDAHWSAFYDRCRAGNPALPATLPEALRKVEVRQTDGLSIRPGSFDLASMSFVAEGTSEDGEEFRRFCRAFAESVRPGGYLVAAFMENLRRYRFGSGPEWPAYPLDAGELTEVFAPLTESLVVSRIDDDPTLPDYGYTGMLMLTARRATGAAAAPA
jgi:hypothetical protein